MKRKVMLLICRYLDLHSWEPYPSRRCSVCGTDYGKERK